MRHHLSSPDDVRALGRVVLVELAHDDAHTQMAEEMTTALYKALQSRGLFHVSRVGRDDPVCRDLPLGRDEPLTLGELSAIRRRLRCDAVLTGRLNAYAPHPRMQVGLYLNLLDLRDGKVVWGVDHVWDTTERRTRRQLKRFYRDRMSGPYGPVDWKLATMSPKHFAKFVAEQAAGTLDDVNAETRKQASVIDRLRGEV
ncbi:MAG: hypothetical protein KGY99_05015 [Phycisphaerae bacterium]|nr:hypothetical protein [Phycisphaerae bacterium]